LLLLLSYLSLCDPSQYDTQCAKCLLAGYDAGTPYYFCPQHQTCATASNPACANEISGIDNTPLCNGLYPWEGSYRLSEDGTFYYKDVGPLNTGRANVRNNLDGAVLGFWNCLDSCDLDKMLFWYGNSSSGTSTTRMEQGETVKIMPGEDLVVFFANSDREAARDFFFAFINGGIALMGGALFSLLFIIY